MANAETIIGSIRRQCTAVFEACQGNLGPCIEDRDDFIAEEGVEFFQGWFDTVGAYDITFADLAAAVGAMDTLRTAFEAVRAKLQVVRTR